MVMRMFLKFVKVKKWLQIELYFLEFPESGWIKQALFEIMVISMNCVIPWFLSCFITHVTYLIVTEAIAVAAFVIVIFDDIFMGQLVTQWLEFEENVTSFFNEVYLYNKEEIFIINRKM